ncbi:MAG: transglutaminase domain-containing protein [Lachnospiraceae bacterium]
MKYLRLRQIGCICMMAVCLWCSRIPCQATETEVAAATAETTETTKKEKTGWKTTKSKKKYYVKKDGSRAVGSYKIKNVYYVFDQDGYLLQSNKAAHYVVGNNIYYVSKTGKALSGWHIMKDKLYYAGKNGKLKTNTTYQGITLQENGDAEMNSQGKWKKKALSIVNSITNSKMSKSQKLRVCWNYMVSTSRFHYVSKYPDINKANWQKKAAYDMFVTHNGNCYSFACGFAALAEEVGYEAYVVCGRVSGSRDHSSDGLTRHAWVMINGRYYDPEAQFAGWYKGVYGSTTYDIRHEVIKKVRYTDSKGTSTTSKKTTTTSVSSKKKGLVKENGNYYYYANGKKITKKWLSVKGKKYYFKKDGAAAVAGCRIGGKYYVFNAKGQLLVGKKTRVVKVNDSYYRVNKSGQAVKGWDKKEKYYYFNNGKRATDIQYMSGKFYYFSPNGVYSSEKTTSLRNAAVYEKDITELYTLLGEPLQKEYLDSCYGLGQDGIWTYKNFKVYTYKDLDGREIFLGAE